MRSCARTSAGLSFATSSRPDGEVEHLRVRQQHVVFRHHAHWDAAGVVFVRKAHHRIESGVLAEVQLVGVKQREGATFEGRDMTTDVVDGA